MSTKQSPFFNRKKTIKTVCFFSALKVPRFDSCGLYSVVTKAFGSFHTQNIINGTEKKAREKNSTQVFLIKSFRFANS